jgi:hypothetical protein
MFIGDFFEKPDIAAAQDRMVRMKRDLDEASARADAEQRAAEVAIASSLSPALAAQFRHAVRRQTYPEIYRDHDRLDAAIGRAMADELRFINEAANKVADKLDRAIGEGRAKADLRSAGIVPGASKPAASKAPPLTARRSESERDLMQVLQRAR